jgi:hypothetical protein
LVTLQDLAKKQDHNFERSLSLGGFVTLSNKINSSWGSQVLNQHFNKQKFDRGLPFSKSVKQPSLNLMEISDQVYDFLSRNKLSLKDQKESAQGLNFTLSNPKSSDSHFKVQINKSNQSYNIKFGSKEPYISRTMQLTAVEDNFKGKIKQFLDKNYSFVKKFSARNLKGVRVVRSGQSNNPERMLFNLENTKSLLTEGLPETVKIEDVEGETDKWELVHVQKNMKIADIYIDKEEEKYPLLYISNIKIPMFKHIKKFASRGIIPQDTAEDVSLFIQPQLKEFEEEFEAFIAKKYTSLELAHLVEEEGDKLSEHEIKIKGQIDGQDPDSPDFVFLQDFNEQNGVNRLEGVIYKLTEDFMMLEMSQGTNDLQIQVPLILNDKQKNETERAIINFLSDRDYGHKIGFGKSVEVFKKNLELVGCKKLSVDLKEEEQTATIKIEGPEKCSIKEQELVFIGIQIVEEMFTHVIFNNKYFKSEHLLTLTTQEQYNATTQRIIRESVAQYESVKEAFEMSQEPMEIDFDKIKEEIATVLTNKVKENKAKSSDDVVYYQALNGDKLQTIMKIQKSTTKILEEDDPENAEDVDLFKFMIYDISEEDNTNTPKAHKEFLLYGHNGYDQMQVLKEELEDLEPHLVAITKL